MENFNFVLPTQIIFGRNRHNEIGQYIKQEERVLILYGSDRVIKIGLLQEIEKRLDSKNIYHTSAGGIKPNPRLSKVNEIVKLSRENEISFILAIGGGSVIDTAKAVAIGVHNTDIWSFFEGVNHDSPVIEIRIGVILTIPAAGSETSSTAVITNDEFNPWEKKDYSHRNLKPVFAILDPELTYSLPWEELSCGGVDMMSHVMERYFTESMDNILTDQLCEAVMRTMIVQLRKIKESLFDNKYDVYSELMWAATLAHSNFLSTGRISDWSSHAIEHIISGIYDIRHGTGLAIIMPAWMLYIYGKHVARFERFAQMVWGINENGMQCAKKGIESLKNFFRYLGQPTSFAEIGITDMDYNLIADKVIKNGSIGQLHKLGKEDIKNILELAR